MLLTPPGSAAVGVLRLAGERVDAFLKSHFSREVPIGRCVHGKLTEGERAIDDPLVVRIDGQTVDINLHGGPWVIQAVIELAERAGFVQKHDDSARFDASNALEREMLESLPSARTELAVRALLAQPGAWRNAKDDPQFDPQAVLSDRSLEFLLNPPRIAIVGAANVGKSTLANQLFAQERSITANVPGTTRDWVGEIANIDGLAAMLIDTPGMRATADAIERTAIERSATQVGDADLVVLVLDASRPLIPDQERLIEQFSQAICVINRCDLPHAWDISSVNAMQTVAVRGEGVDVLRREILSRFGCAGIQIDKPRAWTDRQRKILRRAIGDRTTMRELFL